MIRKLILLLLLFCFFQGYSQYKTDVLVLGGSASGTAAAIQAARSGVKAILVEPNSFLIGNIVPSMDIPAFETGIWKEWNENYKKSVDSMQTDPRITLELMVKKVKGLELLKETQIVKIKEKRNSWEVTIRRNGKLEKIKAKVLVDAFFNYDHSPIVQAKIIDFKDKKMEGLVSYTLQQKNEPYQQQQKLYRTSGATGFGRDSTIIHFLPLGAFISKQKDNLLVISPQAALLGFNDDDFKNIALWLNIGQMTGAIAAYGPFFNTTSAKANVRLTQGEVINFKNIIYPVTDIPMDDYAWYPVQKIITSEILKMDFSTGKFNPEEKVLANEIKGILSTLHPRSRIWFIENKVDELKLADAISLLSFISGKEIYVIERELQANWNDKYKLASEYQLDKFITKKEFAIILDIYLNPFSIGVDMAGDFIR